MTPTRTGGTAQAAASGARRRRVLLTTAAAVVAAVDLAAKAWAEDALPPGGVEAGPVDLRLGYNPGVAFSVGADAPTGLVVAVTAAVTAAVAVIAWHTARAGGRAQLTALALLLGGAVANLVDRAGDGVVTDYLHTGWWPTFNLADTAIVTGALLSMLTAWRSGPSHDQAAPGRATDMDSTAGAAGNRGSRLEAPDAVVDTPRGRHVGREQT